MDFQSLKRRDLQSLCKLNNIPANTTNAAMADALASLPTVEGLGDFLAQGSPERSVNASPNAPRTTATRTRGGTRTRAVEGTDTRKTPATRTTRKRATQEASFQKMIEKDLQTEFEADMEQSGVTESNVLPGCELKENEEQLLSESQSESQNEVQQEVKDGQEIIDLDDCNQHQEQDEATEMSNDSMKVDFHSLSRKDLQNLCKKNKIPANTTNAAMAGALESLEIVEGLQEFITECESRAPSSPLMSGISSSCVRRSRTTMKITREEPRSSKMITKSCRGSRRRIVEETEQGKNDVPETPAAQAASALCEKESIQKKEDSAVQLENSSEASGVAEFNGDISNCLTQEATVNDSTLEDEIEKGNNVENLEEPRELASEIGENIVEEESVESLEVTDVLADFVKIDIGSVAVANSATQDEGLKFGSSESESLDGQLENLVVAPDLAAESLLEKLDIVHAEVEMSKEFVSESATQADQVSLEISEDSKSGNTKLEKVVTFNFDSAAHMNPVELESSHAEDSSDKFDTELTTQADKPSLEINVESEGSCTEDEMSDAPEKEGMSESSDSELTIQDDQLSLETNLDSQSEDSQAADLFANQFDTESTIQVRSCVPTESKTPLKHKSLRKLKRIYKEKLQQEKTLAKKMEKLSLDETEIALANVEENLQEGNDKDLIEESGEDTDGETESDNDSVEQEDVLQDTLVTNPDVETAKLCPVEILVDNEVVPEDAVVGDINVVTCPPQATPTKCSSMTKKPLLFTPTKSSCKTPMSAGRKNRVLDVNKENIDNSVSKPEPGKIKLAVAESGKIISAMSLGKLMKEVKVLEQSEEKRQALQSRSDNHCNLASS